VNDEVPVVAAGLKAVLGCVEGRAAVITAEYLYATDGDSDNGSLTYLIARQPYHGVVLRAGAIVDRFVQADITAGVVSYKHTGVGRLDDLYIYIPYIYVFVELVCVCVCVCVWLVAGLRSRLHTCWVHQFGLFSYIFIFFTYLTYFTYFSHLFHISCIPNHGTNLRTYS